jgi:WD40 repeat protein
MIWDYSSKKVIKDLSGHKGKVLSIGVSNDGANICSSSEDKSIKVWDFYTGDLVTAIENHADIVSSVGYSPIGTCFISTSKDKTVKVWDNRNELIQSFEGHEDEVSSVAITPDGKFAITGSQDGILKMWALTFGGIFKNIKGHSQNVNSVAVSTSGKLAVSGLSNKSLIVWDLSSGKLIKTLKGHTDIISSVAFSPGGKSVASASYDKTLKIWEINSGENMWTLSGHDGAVTSVAASNDKKYIVSGSRDKTIIIWEARTGKLSKRLKGAKSAITSVDISPNGEYIVSGLEDSAVNIWNVKKGKLVHTLEGHKEAVNSVAFSPDGDFIASGSKDQTVKIWKVNTGELDYTFEKINSPVTSVSFSSDGLYVACGTEDNFIRIWDFFEKYQTSYYYLSKVNSAKFIPNMNQIIAGYDSGDVLIWDLLMEEQEELLKELKSKLKDVEDLIGKDNYSEAIEQLNFVLETADVFNFEDLKAIAFEKLKNLRDPKETLEIVKKILEFEYENQRNISKAEMVNQLKIEISETEYYENLLENPVDYEPSETGHLENLGTEILQELLNPTLYALIVQKGYNFNTAKKIGKFLLDQGFIRKFRNFPLDEEKFKTSSEKLEDLIVFVSYATKDADTFKIEELSKRLKSYEEIKEVLYWQEHMTDNIIKFMSDNLGKCNVVLLFCSETALGSESVDKEWTAADMMGKPILPVFLNPDHIPPLLKSRLGIEFDLMDFEKNVMHIHNLILKKCGQRDN